MNAPAWELFFLATALGNMVFTYRAMRLFRECAAWRQTFASTTHAFGLMVDEMAKQHPEFKPFAELYHSKFDELVKQ